MTRAVVWLACLVLLLGGLAVFSIGVGDMAISPGRIVEILLSGPSERHAHHEALIIWELRFPRLLLACFVGAGLAVAGAGYQGLFRNPLADPFIIGASSGASLGATLAIVSGWQSHWFGISLVPLAALAGALLAVAVVYAIAQVGRQVPVMSLLLSGVAVSSLLGSLVSLIMFMQEQKLMTIFGWLMGSLSGRNWSVVAVTAVIVISGTAVLWLHARTLDALTFGEESAAALGLSLARTRSIVVLAATVVTAASVAGGGVIGFIGLISPHIARWLVGPRHGPLILTSGLVGAVLLLVADDIARTIAAPTEIPVGIVTAMLGSPFFLYLLKTRQRELGAA
jgi:iron complex transport system permease protein